MDNGNLSADLTTGMLAPASSVFFDDGPPPHSGSDRKGRRQAQRESEPEAEIGGQTDDSLTFDAAESSPHQLDHLA
jgi:hypothetical protein